MTQDEWEDFQISFHLHCSTFPDNKIYGTIFITPESARSMIKEFRLIVDNCERVTFSSALDVVLIGGFDQENEEKIFVAVEAIPEDGSIFKPKRSNICDFVFNGQIFNLNPILRFKWTENETNLMVVWSHLVHLPVEKYILLLDEQEIHYVYERDFQAQCRVCIHNLETDTKHTLQIIGKMKNKRRDCQSDVIHFTVPKSEDNDQSNDDEMLYVQAGVIPQILKEFVDSDPKEEAFEFMQFREKSLELLEKLRLQIEERNRRCQQPD